MSDEHAEADRLAAFCERKRDTARRMVNLSRQSSSPANRRRAEDWNAEADLFDRCAQILRKYSEAPEVARV